MTTLNASPHEAAALHDGRATAVLRRMEPQPPDWVESIDEIGPELFEGWDSVRQRHWPDEVYLRCPYGRVGDVLEFREAHAFRTDFIPSSDIEKALHYMLLKSQYKGSLLDGWHHYGVWRPASRMPRWAIRLRRPIASIAAIRVAEMTEEQARATGIEPIPYKTIARLGGEIHHDGYVYALSQYYESRHGEGSWQRDFAWYIGLGRASE